MYKVTTPPVAEPITLAEAKAHLIVEHDDDDTLINTYIKAAREKAEHYTGRAMMEQTVKEYLQNFPCVTYDNIKAGIELRFAPLKSLTHVKYKDTDGDDQTLSSNKYTFDNISEPPKIFPAFGESWPATRDDINAIEIEYVAGYTTASDVPANVKLAMLLMIGKWYEQREDSIKNLPTQSKYLLDTVKIQHI